jgi:hypothetical protein
MKNRVSDQDVLNLLTNLKNAEGTYPSDMARSRRDMYIKQAAAMAVLGSGGGNGAVSTQSGQASLASAAGSGLSLGKVLEIALVVALAVEAVLAAYIYRNEIANFINTALSPKVELTSDPAAAASPASDVQAGAEPSTEGTASIAPVTVTGTSTPPSALLPAPGSTNSGSAGGGGVQVQVTSTPDPTKVDPGLHLGQTKQPTQAPNTDNKKTDNNSSNKDNTNTNDNRGNKK